MVRQYRPNLDDLLNIMLDMIYRHWMELLIKMSNRRKTNKSALPYDRFNSKWVVNVNGCWIWNGTITRSGYGQFYSGDIRNTIFAHCWSYEYYIGPIPEGSMIDHICRTKKCVNPCHLRPVTVIENNRRGFNGFRLSGLC